MTCPRLGYVALLVLVLACAEAATPADVAGDAQGAGLDTSESPDEAALPLDVAVDAVPFDDTADPDVVQPALDVLAPGDPATIPLQGPCALAGRVGGFIVEEQQEYSIIDGKVNDSVNPASVLTEELREGVCVLWRRKAPLCPSPCTPPTVCAEGGTCVPFPKGQDVGEVVIDGLEKVIRLTAQQPGNTYFDTELPHPVFLPGKLVRLTASGGTAGPIELHGVGVEPLGVPEAAWILEGGSAIAIAWTTPNEPARSTVALELNIDQHGNSPLFLRCELEDDGQGEIPASLVDALISAGVSGFPSGRLTRRTADHQSVTGGCVDLLVGSPRKVDVRVAGFTPCKKTADCPADQVCDPKTELCVE